NPGTTKPQQQRCRIHLANGENKRKGGKRDGQKEALVGRACGNGRLRRGGGPVVVCQEPPLGKEMTRMAYRLKPGKLGRKAMAAYDKVQRAFVGRFLEKDPDSPSGYASGPVRPAAKRPPPTRRSRTMSWAHTRRSRRPLQTLFWKKQTLRPRRRRGNSKQEETMKKSNFVALILGTVRSEEHTSELQSRFDLVCRLLLEKKKK